jgi:hypothetical protein
LVGFAGSHGDALELFEIAEEVFDQVPPLVHFQVDVERTDPLRSLRNHDFGPPLIQFLDDPVGIEGLVTKESIELDPVDQRCHADGVVAVSRQQHEAHEIAQSVAQREDFGRPAAFGLAYGLILSPPFAPWPCR